MRPRFLLLAPFFLAANAFAGKPTVAGDIAIIRNGIAHAPANAPQPVKNAIWAVNTIVQKPYRWGGGHSTFVDRGYDCSGTVSFLLHHAGTFASPAPSKGLMCWGEPGHGRWITVHTRAGHAFTVVAGLRLDTTGRTEREGPRWHIELRDPTSFTVRHPRGL